jgi:cytochrome oxidase Cu insertion factor (SCO1/SenC/PrrC family)
MSRMAALVGRPLFWAAVVGCLFAAPLLRGLANAEAPPPPPVLAAFPDFALQDDARGSVTARDLRGHAFVASILCARCTEERAAAAETLRVLQRRTRQLGDELRLVSFSPDGDADALAALRERYGGSRRWMMLAGLPDAVRAGFRSTRMLLLVDAQLRVRGAYLPTADGIALLLRDTMLVVASG